MALDLIKAPLFRALFGALMVALAVCIFAPSGAIAAVPWGYNGTIQAQNVSVFLSRAFSADEHFDYLYPSTAVAGQNLFVASWNSSKASVQPNRLGAINLVQNPDTFETILAVEPQPSVPRSAPERPYVAYGYEGPAPWVVNGQAVLLNTGNVMMAGGIGNDGVMSNVAVDVYYTLNSGVLQMTLDGAAFADLPEPMAGGIATLDTTASFFYSNSLYYGNASLLIFAGENSTSFLNKMYRPLYPTITSVIPTGWQEVIPNTTNGLGIPGPRADLAGAARNGKWYIFGGRDDNGVFGDTWVFDMATTTWTNLTDFGFVAHTDASDVSATSQEGKSLPLTPPARYGHSMAFISGENIFGSPTDFIMLVGGTNGATYFDDIWLMDIDSGNWEKITPPTGQSSYTPRAFAGLFASHNTSTAWVFGGHNNATGTNDNVLADLYIIDFVPPLPAGPSFKSLPNNIIAGVAGGILLVLIITVIVLKVTDRNNN